MTSGSVCSLFSTSGKGPCFHIPNFQLHGHPGHNLPAENVWLELSRRPRTPRTDFIFKSHLSLNTPRENKHLGHICVFGLGLKSALIPSAVDLSPCFIPHGKKAQKKIPEGEEENPAQLHGDGEAPPALPCRAWKILEKRIFQSRWEPWS